jgi:hypothetical protein
MDARLVELNRISKLLGGGDPESIGVVEQIRQSAPRAWDDNFSSEKVSMGQVLEAEITARLQHPGVVPVHGLCRPT